MAENVYFEACFNFLFFLTYPFIRPLGLFFLKLFNFFNGSMVMGVKMKIAKGFLSLCAGLILSMSAYGANQDMKFTEPTKSFAFEKEKSYFATIYTAKGKIVCQ